MTPSTQYKFTSCPSRCTKTTPHLEMSVTEGPQKPPRATLLDTETAWKLSCT